MAGRPTKYTPELLTNAEEYVDGGFLMDGLIPTIEGLSLVLGVARETCHVWRHEEGKEEFSNILDKLLSKQSSMVINGALGNDYNATIAKLLLGKHGYSEKTQTDVTSGGEAIKNTFIIQPVTTEKG